MKGTPNLTQPCLNHFCGRVSWTEHRSRCGFRRSVAGKVSFSSICDWISYCFFRAPFVEVEINLNISNCHSEFRWCFPVKLYLRHLVNMKSKIIVYAFSVNRTLFGYAVDGFIFKMCHHTRQQCRKILLPKLGFIICV